MKRIICLSILVLLLCTGTALADSKFEADLFFGSYQPSLSRVNDKFHGLNLKSKNIQGCAFAYEILPNCRIRAQIDFFESKSHCPWTEIDIRLKTIAISVLTVLDLFQHESYEIYGGIGLTDYQVKSLKSSLLGRPPKSRHDFGFPWGTVVLLGVATSPNRPLQAKGEIQYATGADGELFGVPLDWDGFKFLISLGVKF